MFLLKNLTAPALTLKAELGVFVHRAAGAHSVINCWKRKTTLELLPGMVKKEITFTGKLQKVFAGAVCLIRTM